MAKRRRRSIRRLKYTPVAPSRRRRARKNPAFDAKTIGIVVAAGVGLYLIFRMLQPKQVPLLAPAKTGSNWTDLLNASVASLFASKPAAKSTVSTTSAAEGQSVAANAWGGGAMAGKPVVTPALTINAGGGLSGLGGGVLAGGRFGSLG